MLNRANGAWTILFARRFTAPDARLLGFVNLGIQLSNIEQGFAAISVDEGAAFAMHRRDGILLARYPHVDPKIGNPYGGAANFAGALAAMDRGVIRTTSALDRHFDMALRNMLQGLCMYGRLDRRLVVNRRFMEYSACLTGR